MTTHDHSPDCRGESHDAIEAQAGGATADLGEAARGALGAMTNAVHGFCAYPDDCALCGPCERRLIDASSALRDALSAPPVRDPETAAVVEVLAGIAPTKEGACGEEDCSEWDGKRCRITGCQPHGRCEPGWERLVSALDAKAKGGAR